MTVNELETVIENLKKNNKPYLDNCREASALYKDKQSTNLFPIAAAMLGGYMVRKKGALTFLFGLSVRKKIMQFINTEADKFFTTAKHKPKYRNDMVTRETAYQANTAEGRLAQARH